MTACTISAEAQQPPNCMVGGFTISPDGTIWKCNGLSDPATQIPTGGGGATWGAITGTLSDQGDLQTALNGKQAAGSYLAPNGNGSSLTGLTKAQVGLANVENTSDANKPISTATQTALDGKQSTLVSGTSIKTINGSSVLGSGDLVVGGAAAWGSITGTLSTQSDLQTALNGKLGTTGNGSGLTGLTKSQVGLSNVDNTADASKSVSSAATLTTPRTINGVSFNGSANITVPAAGSTLTDNVPVSKLNSGTGASSSTYWRGDGSWATPPGGGSSDTVLRLGSNISTGANTTLVDLTGMSFTADAGGIYSIEVRGIAQSPVATTGYGIGINCAQTPVTVALGGASQLANTGTVTSWSAIANNAIVGVTSGVPSAATNVPVHGGGILVAHATNAGTCIFRLRSETTAVTTLMANSLFIVRKVN